MTHQQELDSLKSEVQALREQLRMAQRLAAVGTMTAVVAHEFNNILTPIISYAQMAQSDPSFVGKAIARAADGGQRASHICNAILGMTRRSGKKESANVCELVNDTLAAMARDPKRDGIELLLSVPANLTIKTCRVELQQVLLNLLINARAAVLDKPAPRRIEVTVEKRDIRVLIHVGDNGTGIAPENLQKIFEPFFTTKDSSSGGKGGHGLGLMICRDIAASLGGEITVSSTVGVGSTFTVSLPSA